jgi:hypothetical protein
MRAFRIYLYKGDGIIRLGQGDYLMAYWYFVTRLFLLSCGDCFD